jgi:hypothetical protein
MAMPALTDDELRALETKARAVSGDADEWKVRSYPMAPESYATLGILHSHNHTPVLSPPIAAYIAAASPDVILRLTAELRKARETIAAHHSGESVTAREFMATLDKDEERAALRDRVGQLEGALRPFADQWKHCSDEWMRDRLKQGGLEDADRREMRAVLRAREALAAGKNGRTTE